MIGHDIIVIGASAGGVEALIQLVSNLPEDLPASIFIVLHISASGTSVLPKILKRHGSLPARHPVDGQVFERGQIYIAPPDQHLLVKQGFIHIVRGPKENTYRPSIDPLFRSAARVYGPRVVGVVLSGMLDDGTAGLQTVKLKGGIAIVQDPADALFPSMPRSAIEHVDVDQVLPLSKIAPALVELARTPVQGGKRMDDETDEQLDIEADLVELQPETLHQQERAGTPSGFACPECGGALWELQDGMLLRFRCRVGHAYSSQTLLSEQTDALEDALWQALRALEEKAALTERLAERARKRNHGISAITFQEQSQDAKERAEVIRRVLINDQGDGQSPISKFAEVMGETRTSPE
ncbi:chemotaxis protein CheB [Leptolyngbya sp. FACHB-261]|uniref:chemotaxis protein CheB n=1 Tax=Leptolyngbya sp. FACHB-261 TaxID=2692806 RepID=UPI00168540B4|nr:chemotaxis protein CheB [Leptolyngbya sp. FACHB-261]MBD2100064.1 chemotaxis protein CheB [Leptolyngbya sp. FACHB-261]